MNITKAALIDQSAFFAQIASDVGINDYEVQNVLESNDIFIELRKPWQVSEKDCRQVLAEATMGFEDRELAAKIVDAGVEILATIFTDFQIEVVHITNE